MLYLWTFLSWIWSNMACCVVSDVDYTNSITSMLAQLQWPTLQLSKRESWTQLKGVLSKWYMSRSETVLVFTITIYCTYSFWLPLCFTEVEPNMCKQSVKFKKKIRADGMHLNWSLNIMGACSTSSYIWACVTVKNAIHNHANFHFAHT